jgi:chromosome partitioning protein
MTETTNDTARRLTDGLFLSQNEMADVFGITSNAVSIAASKLGVQSKRLGRQAVFSSAATRKIFEERGFSYPREVIGFQMLKGGSTKTSSAFNLAVRLNQYGARVLCVDLDMQGNLTDAFGVEVTDEPVFYHVASGQVDINDAVIPLAENLALIPSDFENSTLDFLITSKRLDLRRFVDHALAKVRADFDFVIIDCNPALSSLNISIALACDRIIIPVNPDKFAAKGLKKTVEELERVATEYGKAIPYNLLYTLYDGREASSYRYLVEYGSHYQDRLIPTVIKRNADVKNALDQRKSIFDFPKAPAREDFDLLARGILGLTNKSGNA